MCGAQTYQDADLYAVSDWCDAITEEDTGDRTFAAAIRTTTERVKD